MVTQWEYLERPQYGAAMLNQYGEEGWEMCAVTDGQFIFKRPKAAPVVAERRGNDDAFYPCPECKAPHRWACVLPGNLLTCAECGTPSNSSEWIKCQHYATNAADRPRSVAAELVAEADRVAAWVRIENRTTGDWAEVRKRAARVARLAREVASNGER